MAARQAGNPRPAGPGLPRRERGAGRFAPRRITGEAELVYARIFLEAEQDEVRQFSFGYCDSANVFLKGRLFRITREGLMTELLNTTASGAFARIWHICRSRIC